MYRINLNENWWLNEYDKDCKIPVSVPGDINDALRKAGKTPDPHYDENGKECFWITSKKWEYRLDFSMDEVTVPFRLVFEGIDGNAKIFLNGNFLGLAKNAFRKHSFDVTEKLISGENQLLLQFEAIDELIGKREVIVEGTKEQWVSDGPRTYLRKPAYNFGWDWSIALPSLGISGPVYLECDYKCEVIDHCVRTFMNGRVDFDFEVSDAAAVSGYVLMLTLNGHGVCETAVIEGHKHRTYTTIQIANPRLWYPVGYGEQPLYDYQIQLMVKGREVHTIDGRFGIREVQMLEEPFTKDSGDGRSFRILVNGERVFLKGGNFVPMELWPGIVNPADYEYYLRMTVAANFNIQRIWGGGFYENDRFYELCDEMGIMVWQDFMFASSGHPFEEIRDEVILEATYQIRRLRNHPCIVMWCGCNEDIYSWEYGPQIGCNAHIMESAGDGQSDVIDIAKIGWKKIREHRLKYDPMLYTMLLRGLVSKLCPGTPYVESSPMSHDDSGNMPNSGNCHISSWKKALFAPDEETGNWRTHFDEVCSFNSEFCIQGPCREEYIKRFLKEENHWPPNHAWDFHIQRGHMNLPHFEQTIKIAGATIGQVTDLSSYVRNGQATHLEMMRGEFDSARADYPNNGGTMVWMFNDCWPTSNWSIIDYDKVPKPCYYAAKRACVPYSPILFERKGQIRICISNHSRSEITVQAIWGGENFDGRKVWESCCGEENNAVKAEAFDTLMLSIVDKKNLPQSDYLFLDVKVDGKQLERVIYFQNGFLDVAYPQAEYCIENVCESKKENGLLYEFIVRSDSFVRLFHVIPEDKKARPIISDNYFDLTKGESRRVQIYYPEWPETKELRFGDWYHNWE